jgi:ATP-dependent DNA helicase RecG
MYPPLYLTPIEYETNGKHILYIRVPVSQDVCRCNGRIYDRNHESDIDITHHSDEVYRLYARKSGSYFVNKVTGFWIDSLRSDLIERARNMTRVREKEHPWRSMSDDELLRSAGLILKDEHTQKEGVTIAAILLFGTDSTIMSVLPQHKTDAIFRVFNTDRYDDRDVVITNLIESYDRLISFGKKHLNNTFHLDGIQSVSARDNILREIVSNLLAHRDFSSGYVAKLVIETAIIERNRIYTENANLSHGHGALSLATFEPFSKNPPISKVFREIGLADELGSGMRNTYKYTKMYSGGEPQFVEGDVFRITIPLTEVATATVGPGSSGSSNGAINEPINGAVSLTASEKRILEAIRQNPRITRKELIELLNVGESTVFRATKKLKAEGIIERIGSNKGGYWRVADQLTSVMQFR